MWDKRTTGRSSTRPVSQLFHKAVQRENRVRAQEVNSFVANFCPIGRVLPAELDSWVQQANGLDTAADE